MMACPYKRTLYINGNKLLLADLRINHCIKVVWPKKLDMKEYVLYDFIYIQVRTERILRGLGLPACVFKLTCKEMITREFLMVGKTGSDWMVHGRRSLWSAGSVLFLDLVLGGG